MDDWQLIQAYVEQKSESAFRALVERYTNLVYSAALRQAFRPQLAEEIAQTVFILLAQNAKSFRSDVILPGWLFRTTRFVASRAIRTENRRLRREQEAYQMQQGQTPDDAWLRMAPCLDEGLAQLGETDRNAIILRYFQGEELRQVGLKLGISEEAARKRISRSVEKLRSFFGQRGYSISASLIIATLGSQSVQAAPNNLAGRLASTAMTGGVAAAGFPLVMEILSAWRWTKMKMLGAAGLGCIATVAIIIAWMERIDQPGQSTEITMSNTNHVQTAAVSNGTSIVTDKAKRTLLTPKGESVLHFRVLAADTDEPVANAKLTVNTVVGEKWKMRTDFVTDGLGLCSIPYPTNVSRLDVGVLSHGWGARFATWRSRKDPIPAEYTMRVERLTRSFGGFVVDAAGAPISNAEIFVAFGGTGDVTDQETPRERVGAPGGALPVGKSDENGRWFCAVVPTEHKGFHLEARHPQFSDSNIAGFDSKGDQEKDNATLNKLLTGTLVTRMQNAFTLSGQVLDHVGNPIIGASITEGVQQPVYKTDGSGWFHVAGLKAGKWEFTVSAERFAPKRKSIVLKEGTSPLEIRLHPGGILRIKTVDEQGAPVAGVTVGLEEWGNHRHALTWKARSDSEGRIHWRSAPPKASLELYAVKDGYCYTRYVRFEAGEQEHVIQMRRSLTIPVHAVDAKTGVAIAEFKAYPGYGEDQDGWERFHTVKGLNGLAKVTFEENQLPWRIRVEAPGYSDWTSEPLSENSGKGLSAELVPRDQNTSVQSRY